MNSEKGDLWNQKSPFVIKRSTGEFFFCMPVILVKSWALKIANSTKKLSKWMYEIKSLQDMFSNILEKKINKEFSEIFQKIKKKILETF